MGEENEVSEENAVALKLKKLVSEGKMTPEKARKKMWLQTRVESGDITLEQATAKMAAWEAKHKEDNEVSEGNAVALKLKKLVSGGEMTPEKAKKKLALRKMIDNGDITLEQATAKMAAWSTKGTDVLVV